MIARSTIVACCTTGTALLTGTVLIDGTVCIDGMAYCEVAGWVSREGSR